MTPNLAVIVRRSFARSWCVAMLMCAACASTGEIAQVAQPQPAAPIIERSSASSFAVTLVQLRTAIERRGARVVAAVDHGAGAASVGAALRPTTVLIFGNPAAGTPLMQADQRLGLELPLRALVYEDADGRVSVGVPDIRATIALYGAEVEPGRIEAIEQALAGIAEEAVR